MKKTFILIVWLIVAGAQPLWSQLKKGDWTGSFSSLFSQTKRVGYFGKSSNISLNVSGAGLMLTDHWMVGCGLSGAVSKYDIEALSKNNLKWYGAKPFFRYYYFEKNKWMPFAYVGFRLLRVVQKQSGTVATAPSLDKYWKISGRGGLGLNYFFSKNIALELTLSTVLYENTSAFESETILLANAGIRTFFNGPATAREDGDLMERYLRQGNYILSGKARFYISQNNLLNTNVNLDQTSQRLYLSPSLAYFIKDRTLLSFNPVYSFWFRGRANSLKYGFRISMKKYLQVGRRLFFAPDVMLGVNVNRQKTGGFSLGTPFPGGGGGSIPEVVSYLGEGQGRIGGELVYFTKKRTFWSAGISILAEKNYHTNNQKPGMFVDGRAYIEATHFFSSNLFLRAGLYLNIAKGKSGEGILLLPSGGNEFNSQSFSWSLGYFIFKKDKTERTNINPSMR